jgi:hypothetical protein
MVKLRKKCSVTASFAASEYKDELLKTMSEENVRKLLVPHYKKPLCNVANDLKVSYEVLVDCCVKNHITNWKIQQKKKRVKKIKHDDFIVGTYNDDEDSEFIPETFKNKKQKLVKREIDTDEDFSTDSEIYSETLESNKACSTDEIIIQNVSSLEKLELAEKIKNMIHDHKRQIEQLMSMLPTKQEPLKEQVKSMDLPKKYPSITTARKSVVAMKSVTPNRQHIVYKAARKTIKRDS